MLFWFEPTDIFRASKPFDIKEKRYPTFISPNYQEFLKIYKTLYPKGGGDDDDNSFSKNSRNIVEDCIYKGYKVGEIIDNLIITLGKEGVLVINKGEENDSFYEITKKCSKYIKKNGQISHRLYKPKLLDDDDIVNVSGAGDCFAGGFISAMLDGENEKNCVKLGFKCCIASLKSCQTVPSTFY
ncbi:conserved hypothetical protein [Pediculus humanus corporis]|uniref:Carbohydrate kinase PfkB domain-containing protein n=1 Tax=Pediculus humanus subsp. corporis TaxID=121224 RepID=E0VM70_PEDHC|nr:uncharacterized protein Phum_PHUM302490 [Pediculus humanus corporis]EEB14476.1 conserved hypothetical protein [Pediculus humanus corporis]